MSAQDFSGSRQRNCSLKSSRLEGSGQKTRPPGSTRPGGGIAPGFPLLVERQAAAVVLQTRVFLREALEGTGLPGNRIEKIACLGVGGGEGPQVIGVFPVGQDAGAGCLGDGPGSRAEFL